MWIIIFPICYTITSHLRRCAHAQTPISCGIWTKACFDYTPQPLSIQCGYFYLPRNIHLEACARSLTLHVSTAVHAEYQKAEEHSDSHEGDGRRGGEELPVVDAEIPHHSQYHHENGHD